MISAKLSRILSIFALSGASVLAAAAPAAAQGGPIALGEPIAGLVTAERGDSWTIELRQGMFLRIDLTRERTSSLNPEIALVGEGGRLIASARAAAGTGTVRLTVSCLPRSGRYAVVARSIEGRLGGRYTLKIEPIMVAAELGAETVACAATDEATERARGECARPTLRVEAGNEAVRVPRGETRHVVLAAGGDVRWSCDPQAPSPQTASPQTTSPQTPSPQTASPQTASPQTTSPQTPGPQNGAEAPGEAEQRIACGDASTLLRVSRQPNGRGVELTCFSRRFVDGPDERLGDRSRLTGTPPAASARAEAAPAAR